MDDFLVGDRVRLKNDPDTVLFCRIVTMTGLIAWNAPAVRTFHPYEGDREINEGALVLVERPHYAEPGVAMVAMTPERIGVLEAIVRGMYDKFPARPLNGRVLEEIIAEARGEVRP